MGKLTLDAATVAMLDGLGGRTELYDEQGNLLAVALPPFIYEALRNPRPLGPFTEAELADADRASGPGRLLEDILKDLRAWK